MNEVTLKKIAEILKISISTVSRSLKNHPEISKKTKEKVLALAQSMDYEPNINAINLRTNHSKVFGLIVPSITNTFYTSFIASIEEESKKKGYSLLILQSGDDPIVELTNLKICKQNRISGLFVCLSPSTVDVSSFINLSKNNVPVIFYDKVPEFEMCNKVCVADIASATLAANAIIEKSKSKILGLFGNTQLLMTKKRMVAFTNTINNASYTTSLYIENALSSKAAEDITTKYIRNKKINTIFCMSDEILTGVMKAIQNSKLKVPKDIGVITISNGELPTLYHPQITYIETSGFKLGKLAFSNMLSCLGGSTFIRDISLDAVLVEGGSL